MTEEKSEGMFSNKRMEQAIQCEIFIYVEYDGDMYAQYSREEPSHDCCRIASTKEIRKNDTGVHIETQTYHRNGDIDVYLPSALCVPKHDPPIGKMIDVLNIVKAGSYHYVTDRGKLLEYITILCASAAEVFIHETKYISHDGPGASMMGLDIYRMHGRKYLMEHPEILLDDLTPFSILSVQFRDNAYKDMDVNLTRGDDDVFLQKIHYGCMGN